MRMRERIAARFYRSSDRTHTTPIRWTKKERAEWEAQQREHAVRVIQMVAQGNLREAHASLVFAEHLFASGIHTAELNDARNAFRACL